MAIPLCPYFRKCGGCSAQHVDYDIQLENKRNVVMHATGIKDIAIFHDKEYHYRNRMDFIFHPAGIGLREKSNWQHIIDINQCAIANETINKIVTEIRAFFREIDAYDLRRQTGTFKQVVIRAPATTSSVSFVLSEKSTRLTEAIERIKEFSKITIAKNVLVTYIAPESEVSISENYFVVKGEDTLTEEFIGKKFKFNAQGFFQNNSNMAEKMLEYVNGLLKKYPTKEAHLLDLYGGVGTFGIVNSDLFKTVTTVESFKGSIDAAKRNIEINSIKNADALVLDAKQIYKANLKHPLYVITDPPRAGMEQKAIIRLKEVKPEVIIYVSCNPAQLGKDLQKFKEFEIISAAVFDLFPQTPHVEAVVEMKRKKEVAV
jgi:23S rRNA (uracil1939-C5)-methyltransferase